LNHWVPWLIALGNVSSIFLTTRGKVAGFWVLIVTQLGFILYAVSTDQVGFVAQNVAMTGMGAYGVWRWMRKGVHRDATRTKENV
jgi:hypothetical protein